jgi:exodeoxyribonuclease III
VNDDALQGMLFGATSAAEETTEDGPIDELRLCALNVNSPNPRRAQPTCHPDPSGLRSGSR